MDPDESVFDWRGFYFFCAFSTSVVLMGTAAHYGTLYAAAVFMPAPVAAVASAQLPVAQAEPLPPAPDPKDILWQQVVDHAPWEPRDSAASFVFKNRMWILGGLNGNGVKAGPDHAVEYGSAPYFNDIWSSDDGAHWIHEGQAPWETRRSMAVVEFGDKLWMLGGWTPKAGYTSDIWSSDDGRTWQKVVEQAVWKPREGHTLMVWQNKLWLLGGVNYDERATYNDVWQSADGATWAQMPDAPWSSRWDHGAAELGGKLYVAGGMKFDKQVFNDVWATEDGVQWERVLARAPWLPRQGHQLISHNDVLYMLGRLNDDTTTGTNDLWYTRDGVLWEKTAEDPMWQGREDHGALLYKNRLWILGGMDVSWHWQNDVWRSTELR